jgi:hypothetical protein
MSKSLYDQLKQHLPDAKGAISDETSIFLDKRDFLLNQISPISEYIKLLDKKHSYPDLFIYSTLDGHLELHKVAERLIFFALQPVFNKYAFYFWLRLGDDNNKMITCAPNGFDEITVKTSFLKSYYKEFKTTIRPFEKSSNKDTFSILLAETATIHQTRFAYDTFSSLDKALLILRNYTKLDSKDEREYAESKGIFVCTGLDGHAFALKL